MIRFTSLCEGFSGDINAIMSPGLPPCLFQCSLLTHTTSASEVDSGFKEGYLVKYNI